MKTIIVLPRILPRFSVTVKRSGAGIIKDKRTKRNRSRSDQRRNAIREQD